MSQEYQSIGQLAPEAEAVTQDPAGWLGERPEQLNVEQTEHDFSFRRQRSNTQALGRSIHNMAGYDDEPPMAAMPVQPY